jgi:hypothetical protein
VRNLPPRESPNKYSTLERKEISVQCEAVQAKVASLSPSSPFPPSPPSSPSYREESIQTVSDRPRKQASRSSPAPPESRGGKYKKYQLKAAKIPLAKFL